jgi:hypothetical protein
MEGQEGQEEIADDKAASELAWFAVKVALAGLAIHFAGYAADCAAAGDAAAIVFLAGWLFGVRNLGEDKAK